ncbi:cysteine proteinase inhibitor 12 [Ziziphus jujuba]|uniref:Cysteine proteinase inhibitor n=2 Tax=Ziziphus jujuba TaxID=326968 RepID=A0A6P4ANT8_ZIZJJ|nr:cysteine proteinase inhibitor 12 [Ziziphus jujuba]KAH7511703.1 hypothetical protein FEM48_Zijuj12G0010800 [Ziziphus jujuba var. spinosa]
MKVERMLLSVAIVVCWLYDSGVCREDPSIRMKLGGIHDCRGSHNTAEIQALARFAVQQHNSQKNALLEFARVVKAREQVVAGKIYDLTLEAMDAGQKKLYEAKVWVKPWMSFKQLQEFKYVHDVSSFTPSDPGLKQGWQAVPIHGTDVQDAAHHVVMTLQQKSNSLSSYKLLEILFAKAKVIEDYVKFELLLKVKRGIKEEKFRVEVNKNIEGKFYLSQMEQDSS